MGKLLAKGASNSKSKPEDAFLHLEQVAACSDEYLAGNALYQIAKICIK